MSNDARAGNTQVYGQIVETLVSPIHGLEASAVEEQIRDGIGIPQSNGVSMAKTTVSVAVDPVALITTECITVTSAMRKHARWAHSSVAAILGGSSSPMKPSMQNSRPSTPRDELGNRKSHKVRSSSGFADGSEEGGLANRWGLRGKKGKSMQDNPLMAGFGRLRRELTGCKGKNAHDLC
jgi:brefeldin A-resistance guanine nucleotide exchange factor 1